MNRESLHTPEIEKLRKLVAERRKKMGKQQHLGDQKHKSSINLLSFFRGPTASVMKKIPKVVPKSSGDVTISKVTYASNAPPLENHVPMVGNVNSVPNKNVRPVSNLHYPSSKMPSQFPRAPLYGNNQIQQAPQQQSLPLAVHSVQPHGRGFPQQIAPKQQENRDRFQSGLTKPAGTNAHLSASNIVESLRNMAKPYSQDFRKINGNKVDPSLLLSQGYWSKPQKVQPKPRSIPIQTTGGQDYAGKVYNTLTLPMENAPGGGRPGWGFASNLPTTKSRSFQAPTDRRSFLPVNAITDLVHQQQAQQYVQVQHRDQLQQPQYQSRQALPRDQFPQGSYFDSLSLQQQPQLQQHIQLQQPQSFKYQQSLQPSLQTASLPYGRDSLHQAATQDQLYIGPKTALNQLNHQLQQNGVSAPAFGQVGTERPYYGVAPNQNNYVVSIKKRRELDSFERLDDGSNDFSRAQSHADLDRNHNKRVLKRSIFDESRKSDEEVDQESVLESLTSDDTDGGEVSNDLNEGLTGRRIPGLRVIGSAVATPVKGPGLNIAMKHDIPAMEGARKERESGKGHQSFRLIEKASYRPNYPDNDRGSFFAISSENTTPKSASKIGTMGPVVVNLPFSNGNDAVKEDAASLPLPMAVSLPSIEKIGKVNRKIAPQQGTSLDLLTSFNKMNPPDPRETSSYTEAHVDNPNINAIASAKIYHGDDSQSNGKTSTNIEITGVGGDQPSSDQEQGQKAAPLTSLQNTQPDQNTSDAGAEGLKGNEGLQEAGGLDDKGK